MHAARDVYRLNYYAFHYCLRFYCSDDNGVRVHCVHVSDMYNKLARTHTHPAPFTAPNVRKYVCTLFVFALIFMVNLVELYVLPV